MLKKLKTEILNKEALLLTAITLIAVSNLFVIANVLSGLQSDFTNRYFILIAASILLINEIIVLVKALKNKEIIKIVIETIIIIVIGIIIIKYLTDNANYFKDNNITNYYLQIIVGIKVITNAFLNYLKKGKTNLVLLIAPILFITTLLVFQGLDVSNTKITGFYKVGVWLNIVLLINAFINNYKTKNNNKFRNLYIILLIVFIVFSITSFGLVLSGKYTKTYLRLAMQFISFSFFALYSYKALSIYKNKSRK